MKRYLCLIILTLACFSALSNEDKILAVLPDEVLENPALEERARILSKGLRCLVCQNETIDESLSPFVAPSFQ